MTYAKDFSRKVVAALTRKNITVTGATAIPGFPGGKYFAGTAYTLVWDNDGETIGFHRTYAQVEALALSSWDPAEYFRDKAEAEGDYMD